MPKPSDQPDAFRSMTGGGFYFDEDGAHIFWTLAAVRRLIDAIGGPKAAAAALDMDARNMQRIYSGRHHCSPTLARRLAEAGEATDGKA